MPEHRLPVDAIQMLAEFLADEALEETVFRLLTSLLS